MHCGRDRRQARQHWRRNPALGSVHARWTQEHRARCDRMGAQDGGVRRRRNPADQHGSRRHQERLRPCVDAGGIGRDLDSRDRVGRRGVACASRRRHHRRARRCGACRQHLPLWRTHGR
ncbi:Phosphoribosyl-AMP cyclohydrolase [Caballeronia sordidicola]|uniref:Phosphoribosyl-AMP cyclohydrolase n=1 Tax=Caballeronia sordidicola TaxID=196367 RepID=A0A242MJ37_CABSO|nr:Phosphoribosyl-AMP cyclohydrolase [Caballeronia sordidicola]